MLGKREDAEETPKNPYIAHHNCSSATPRLKFGTLVTIGLTPGRLPPLITLHQFIFYIFPIHVSIFSFYVTFGHPLHISPGDSLS